MKHPEGHIPTTEKMASKKTPMRRIASRNIFLEKV